jgi:hypothetical protein
MTQIGVWNAVRHFPEVTRAGCIAVGNSHGAYFRRSPGCSAASSRGPTLLRDLNYIHFYAEKDVPGWGFVGREANFSFSYLSSTQ